MAAEQRLGLFPSPAMDDSAQSSKPLCLREDALAVVQRLQSAAHTAYFAGGCVRDLLLGLEPKDFDVATDAPPARVRELFSNTQAVGQAFGVILVHLGRSVIEVATFRDDGRYLDGRHPQSIRFASAEQDAQRRDFTINGLFLDPLSNRVIDYVNGQRDLGDHVLRAIGRPEERFEEDHLRLLRAVRFASRFNLTVEPHTARALSRHAPQLIRISPERIAEELRMVLTPPTRAQAWTMLWQYGLIEPIFRFLEPLDSSPFDPARSIFLQLDPARDVGFSLALAAACLCVQWQRGGRPDDPTSLLTRPAILAANHAMRKALKISNDESDCLKGILTAAATLLDPSPPSLATRKRFIASAYAADTRLLLLALRKLGWCAQRIDELGKSFAELDQQDCAPAPLITGDDLLAAGLQPGPIFRRVLAQVYDAQLEGRIHDRQQAIELAMLCIRSNS